MGLFVWIIHFLIFKVIRNSV